LNLRPVCQQAFLHITGLSKGFLYSYNRWLDGSEPTVQDRAIDANRLRRPRHIDSPLKETALAWLRELSTIATVLPNCSRGFKILPYRTPNAVHAIFVREMELQLECAWVNDEAANYDVQGGNRWLDNIVEDPVPAHCQNPVALPNAAATIVYRYGNCLLGKKESIPQAPGIASFSYFK
jgi:hypothetical protein